MKKVPMPKSCTLELFFNNEGKKDYSKDAYLKLTAEQWVSLELHLQNAALDFESGNSCFDTVEEAACSYYEAMRNDLGISP